MKALFLLQHNNDFDSITPVIAGWVEKSTQNHALVHVSNPSLNWRGDFRSNLLLATGRVEFCDIWQLTGNEGGFLCRSWVSNTPDQSLRRGALRLATELTVARRALAAFARKINTYEPDIIAFDHYDVPSRRRKGKLYGYQEALEWAKARKVPLVALPHGLLLFRHEGMQNSPITTPYDVVFVESEERAKIMQPALAPGSRISVSGSPRYDPSWVERLASLNQEAKAGLAADADRVRMVFFATTAKHYYEFPRLLEWLGEVASHPKIELVVQPHPRGQRASEFAAIENRPNVIIDPSTPASTLIAEAQIVSTLVSSVVVEAIIREREILYPRFLNAASTFFDTSGACVALQDQADTSPAIDAFVAGKRVSRRNYEAFLRNHVFGGKSSATIARIVAEMTGLASQKQ